MATVGADRMCHPPRPAPRFPHAPGTPLPARLEPAHRSVHHPAKASLGASRGFHGCWTGGRRLAGGPVPSTCLRAPRRLSDRGPPRPRALPVHAPCGCYSRWAIKERAPMLVAAEGSVRGAPSTAARRGPGPNPHRVPLGDSPG